MGTKFIQIHTLTSYPPALLNRDDVGFAKRVPFGGAERVRISSQCLKRHWRTADDQFGLDRIELGGELLPMSVRSRRTFEKQVFQPLVNDGVTPEVAEAITSEMIKTVFPKGKGKEAEEHEPDEESEGTALRTSQVTVIGQPEVQYLATLARQAAEAAQTPAEARKSWALLSKELRKNLKALSHGAGLDAAMFGRMVTGDILSRCDGAIHVAHSFTVDAGSFETDYFSAVDDLQPQEETGSGHINTSELTTGLFYGYVVIDLPLLVSNLEGCERADWAKQDRALAGEVVRRLVHLVATVSPGAKRGATAPYAQALAVLVEAGDSLPRTLANAFLDAVRPSKGLLRESFERLACHLDALDAMYGRTTQRQLAAIEAPERLLTVVDTRLDLPGVANWAAAAVKGER
jgi:CRISPR system Cascade subunit CasC